MPKFLGKTALWWGTLNQDKIWGLCNNVAEKHQAEKEEIRNGDNDIVGLAYSGDNRVFTLEYTPIEAEGGGELPTSSQDLIGGMLPVVPLGETQAVNCVVDEAEKKAERGKVATFSLTVTYYPKLELPT